MRFLIWLAAIAILGGITVQLYHLYRNNSEIGNRLEEARAAAKELGAEKDKLEADLDYFSQPENLAKELKEKFDYKRPGEKLIKIQ